MSDSDKVIHIKRRQKQANDDSIKNKRTKPSATSRQPTTVETNVPLKVVCTSTELSNRQWVAIQNWVTKNTPKENHKLILIVSALGDDSTVRIHLSSHRALISQQQRGRVNALVANYFTTHRKYPKMSFTVRQSISE